MYLRVKFSDLQEIMRFIYTGQCKVVQDNLDEFLEIAKSLEVPGIANDEDSEGTKISNRNSLETVNNANDELRKVDNVSNNQTYAENNKACDTFENNKFGDTVENSINEKELSETTSEIDNVSESHDENKDNNLDATFEKIINEKDNKMTRKEETGNVFEVKDEPEENEENAHISCNQCKLTFETNPQLKEHLRDDHLFCCNKFYSSVKSLKSHKWAHRNKKGHNWAKIEHRTIKVDPNLHYPETEEKMSFFGSGRKKNQAYDKHFFTFR